MKLYTLGCKVNQYETEFMRQQLEAAGLKNAAGSVPADYYLINTCTVTNKADSESLGLIRRARRQNPKATIIVTGCLVGLDSARIKKCDAGSILLKNRDKNNIVPAILSRKAPCLGGISSFHGHTRAFVKVQDGCANRCSYCKIPYVRGKPVSRKPEDIIREAHALVASGFKELVLCGICLGAYGQDFFKPLSLAFLLGELEKLEGDFRVRLSSIEAGDVSDELIGCIAGSSKICRHMHIPIQSGDDGVLKAMNRNYTAQDYLFLVRKVKKRFTNAAITTDVIAGFPGETEADFQATVKLVKQIMPLRVHVFGYSERQFTPAAKLTKKVSPEVIRRRVSAMIAAADKCSFIFRRRFLGRTLRVLVEKCPSPDRALCHGYSDNYLNIVFPGSSGMLNSFVDVRLNKIERHFTGGKIIAA